MPETNTGSEIGNSLLPQTHGGLPSRRTSHSCTPGNLDPRAHRDIVRRGTGATAFGEGDLCLRVPYLHKMGSSSQAQTRSISSSPPSLFWEESF